MIEGFAIGHHTADGDGWLTGTTVVSALSGAVGGVDVRGGGPGTRETDLLDPAAMVDRVDAVVLTGGSAYGLAAADGVMAALAAQERGFRVGPRPEHVVPIVPAVVLFDLECGGHFENRPTAEFGRLALTAVTDTPASGCVGAGTGAKCGGLKSGFGWAEQALSGGTIAAAAAVNAAGSAVDPRTGRLWADVERRWPDPTAAQRAALAEAAVSASPSLNTTIGVVLTDLALTKAQATKLAAVAHDGLARAIRPVHSMRDGDTIFCLASGIRTLPADPLAALAAYDALLTAAAEVFEAACLDAMLVARSRGPYRAYADLVPFD